MIAAVVDGGTATVSPGAPPARWSVRVPGSKSITNRALLLAGLAAGRSLISGALVAQDTLAMTAALSALGAGVVELAAERSAGPRWQLDGLGGGPQGPREVCCAQAGTVARFLIPAIAAGSGEFRIDADPQLRRRPLGPVLAALRAQGATIAGDRLPLTLVAAGLTGGEIAVDTSVSSQFLSGLLMAAPLAAAPTTLRFATLVSQPYIDLTLATMAAFGVHVRRSSQALTVTPGGYRAADFEVEPDASTASYFLASAALTATTVTLPGLDLDRCTQGDLELVALLERMGCRVLSRSPLTLRGSGPLSGIVANMSDSSDVFMTLACVAPFATSPTTIEGIAHARVKESDRIAAVAENLRRVGITVDERPDAITIHPGPVRSARLPTYGDHRIAMAFALIGTRVAVELETPTVVAKTFPEFFTVWPVTGAVVEPGTGAQPAGGGVSAQGDGGSAGGGAGTAGGRGGSAQGGASDPTVGGQG